MTDYCGRDFEHHANESFVLPGFAGPLLPIPARYRTALKITKVSLDGSPVTWALSGASLLRPEGWRCNEVEVVGSWGYTTPPPLVLTVVCAEVIRWLSVSPGTLAEKTGDLEIHYAASASAQGLSEAAKVVLSRYRPKLASLPLTRS